MDSRIKIFDIAFGKGVYTRDRINYQVSCPECDKTRNKKKLHIRVEDLRYHCWVCGLKGKNVLYLVKKVRPDLDVGPIKVNKVETNEEEIQDVLELPKGLIPIYRETKDPDVKSVRNYLFRRGLSVQDLFRWRVLTATSGSFRRYAVFPSYDSEGNLNYYLGRSIDEDKIRYKNAKKKKTTIVFNEIDIDWKSHVYLVEGVFDALKCPDNTIPMLGSELSKSSLLYEKLLRNQCTVTIALDKDAEAKMYKTAKLLSAGGCKVYTSVVTGDKDLGDMTKNNALSILKNAPAYDEYNGIRHKIGILRSGSIF